jgi:hypothetical protein
MWKCFNVISVTVLFIFNGISQNKVLEIKGGIPIFVHVQASKPLDKALQILNRDLKTVLGQSSDIQFVTNEISDNSKGLLLKINPNIGGAEAHRVRVVGNQIVLEGADRLGLIYAMYTFSEKILGIPPLWFWASQRPERQKSIKLKKDFLAAYSSPHTKYRAWFPNDMDYFFTWRQLDSIYNEVWLETALRLKLNTIEWHAADAWNYEKPYSLDQTRQLIHEYGFYNTTHHHSPVYSSFRLWDEFWTKAKGMPAAPKLSLANKDKIEAFWRYNIETIARSGVDMIWVTTFRGAGDHPFWYTFEDAPESMKERGKIIDEMVNRQVEMIKEITGNTQPIIRYIFYNELSDLLAADLIHPPKEPNLIWNFVAARRDHYPNEDIQAFKQPNAYLGYYMNLQFTSTGSHVVQAEGPWKMEKNYRYVNSKSNHPLLFSVVNAGNIREHVLTLCANAELLWNFEDYSSDEFILNFTKRYFGEKHAAAIADLYRQYFNAYWKQRKPDLEGFERQFIFQDLRYKQVIHQITDKFNQPYHPNPLEDYDSEQVPGRTFRIVPEDNVASNQVEAILKGTEQSAQDFQNVLQRAKKLESRLAPKYLPFYRDNLVQPAAFMMAINNCVHDLVQAYQVKDNPNQVKPLLQAALQHFDAAQQAMEQTLHGDFKQWYEQDRVFDWKDLRKRLLQIK